MPSPAAFLRQEAAAMLTRLDRVRPFVVHETMVAAAAPAPAAMSAVERLLLDGRSALRANIGAFVDWLTGPGAAAPAHEQQRRFTVVRLAFNDVLSQFDLFTEAMTQRSEHETGVWLSGLDMLATDALRLARTDFTAPPVLCYLARGPGAAIRRARTRLPGGVANPVALIRVPRERMVGHGIASSLVHEVGHQAAALLGLVDSLRAELDARIARGSPAASEVWNAWRTWVSEIVADLWSVAKLGVCATLGLIGVVSLPRRFVFRDGGTDPHPVPWLRVQLSCALGRALYPDPQWDALADLWARLYPPELIPEPLARTYSALSRSAPAVADALLAHRPPALGGETLGAAVRVPSRAPGRLLDRFDRWRARPAALAEAAPTLAFAVIGQARSASLITPSHEARLLSDLLTGWAVRSSLDTSVLCAKASSPPVPLLMRSQS